MIKHLKLKNFKAWLGDSADIDLAPVTLFLGGNSTGKSSLIQSLLLLKQTAMTPDRSVHLNLGGDDADYVDLGRFDDVLSKGGTGTHFAIDIEAIEPEDEEKRNIIYRVEYGRTKQDVPYVHMLHIQRNDWKFQAQRSQRGAYKLSLPNDPNFSPLEAKREYAPERSIFLSAKAVRALGIEGRELEDISFALRETLDSIAYLGPLRRKPERYYTWNKNRPEIIGADGSQAIPALLASAQNRNSEECDLIAEISKWLKKMGIAEKLEVKRIGSSTQYSIIVHRDRVAANLLDVGVGISQVLPVLTLAYFAKPGSTVILEEPEIHLHPLAQSVLAELFVEVSNKRNVQFIIETHSEHLFRRLQTLMAKETLNQGNCRLYFVEREGKAAKMQELTVDDFGRVQHWPDKFFGDAMGELREQAQLMTDRMKKDLAMKKQQGE